MREIGYLPISLQRLSARCPSYSLYLGSHVFIHNHNAEDTRSRALVGFDGCDTYDLSWICNGLLDCMEDVRYAEDALQ
jgi:hypothetical protein